MIDRDLATATYAVLAVLVCVAAVVGVADYRASLADGGVEGPAADCPALDGGAGADASGSDDPDGGSGEVAGASTGPPDCGDGPETVATTGAS